MPTNDSKLLEKVLSKAETHDCDECKVLYAPWQIAEHEKKYPMHTVRAEFYEPSVIVNWLLRQMESEARSDAISDFCKEAEETTKKKAYECAMHNSIVISVKDWNALKQKHRIKE